MRTASLSAVVAHVRQLSERDARRCSERQLLASFTSVHDEAAFAEIVRLHGPMVLATCRRVLRHTQDAEDAFQATFLVLARKAASIRTGDSLGGWLYQVAFRLAVRARSENERRRARQPALDFDTVSTPSRHALCDALNEELERLPEAYRTAIVLCYLEGRTQVEAARLLATTADAVNSRLKRGRELLRQRVARGGLILSETALAHALAAGAAEAALSSPAIQGLARTALQFAANQGPVSGVTAQAVSLTKDALPSLIPTNVKIASALILAVVAVINPNGGRDHYPLAFTTLLAGRGIKGGQAVGKTSADGVTVEERPVAPQEFLATIYHALGVDPSRTNRHNSGVMIPLVEKGNLPVKEALR